MVSQDITTKLFNDRKAWQNEAPNSETQLIALVWFHLQIVSSGGNLEKRLPNMAEPRMHKMFPSTRHFPPKSSSFFPKFSLQAEGLVHARWNSISNMLVKTKIAVQEISRNHFVRV